MSRCFGWNTCFCREKTAAECPHVQLVRHSQSISTTCNVLPKIAAFVVGEDNKYSDILLKIRLQIHTLVARKRPNVSLQWCSRTRSPTSNPSSPKRESRLLQTPSQLCHFPFKTPMLLPRCTIPTFHPADRAGKREPRCGWRKSRTRWWMSAREAFWKNKPAFRSHSRLTQWLSRPSITLHIRQLRHTRELLRALAPPPSFPDTYSNKRDFLPRALSSHRTRSILRRALLQLYGAVAWWSAPRWLYVQTHGCIWIKAFSNLAGCQQASSRVPDRKHWRNTRALILVSTWLERGVLHSWEPSANNPIEKVSVELGQSVRIIQTQASGTWAPPDRLAAAGVTSLLNH